ncbi:hypothetical protein MTQ10_01315 [Streptomyces sp. XM83C]|jgi:hypothetical protein|uniref:DUF1795 domain-containing protein n=1 Tax=Streptomyces thermocoprophilus TaxID=78356 RepID=A0ABV5VA14_9ACTN|nr:hypothetical protein [Streptomyces sp. XM83C]MCK1818275.1 hypothetical protein [Streptomyces sp. XM83C]
MPATLPTPIEFRMPQGWLPARPGEVENAPVAFAAVHPHPDNGFAANITIDGDMQMVTVALSDLADAAVERLREVAESVTVVGRRDVATAGAPSLIQRLAFTAAVHGVRRDLAQTQVYLSVPDARDARRRAVIRLVLTASAAQHDEVLGEFQDIIRSIRLDDEVA